MENISKNKSSIQDITSAIKSNYIRTEIILGTDLIYDKNNKRCFTTVLFSGKNIAPTCSVSSVVERVFNVKNNSNAL